jgi:uncharacterized protein YndB with AHSA1/START domain
LEGIIRHEFVFTQPPEEVWNYLTDPELLALWLMPNDFKPVVGHRFQFKARARLGLKFNGDIYCRVLEIIPFRKLVYSWQGGMSKENPSLDSIVMWTLTSSPGGGTILLLEHKGFRGMKNSLAWFTMNIGWAKIGRRLRNHINQKTL